MSEEIIKEIMIQYKIDKNMVSHIVKVYISTNWGQAFFNCKNLDEHLLFATHWINEMVMFFQSVNSNVAKLNSHCQVSNSTHHNGR